MDSITCPNCHTVYRREDAPARAGGMWRVNRMDKHYLGGGASQAATESVRKTPVSNAASSIESSFQTPLYIALASGAFAFAVSALVLHFYVRDAIGIATVTAGAVWGWQVVGDRALKYTVERITGHDWDGDGYVGEPPEEPQKNLRVTVTEQRGNGSWTGYFDSPVEPPVLGKYARAVRAGRKTGYRHWAGEGKSFVSREEYEDFRDELISQGLAKWNHPKSRTQGFSLTKRGEAVFKELSNIPATPPPELRQ